MGGDHRKALGVRKWERRVRAQILIILSSCQRAKNARGLSSDRVYVWIPAMPYPFPDNLTLGLSVYHSHHSSRGFAFMTDSPFRNRARGHNSADRGLSLGACLSPGTRLLRHPPPLSKGSTETDGACDMYLVGKDSHSVTLYEKIANNIK